MVDDGHAVHYNAVTRGTPVYSADGDEVGRVYEVVDNYAEHILDGIVIEGASGEHRFVDGPEVGRTAERGVTLTISASEVAKLPPPEDGPPRFSPSRSSGRFGRLFGGGPWKRS